MKNITRKILIALLLVFTMMMSIVTVSSFAAEGETVTIYFQNNWLWSNVSVHYWGDGETSWPGNPMTLVGQDAEGYEVYSAEIPAGVTGIVINGVKDDGSGALDQTPDITEGIVNGAGWKMEWNNGNLAVAYSYAGADAPITPPIETPDDDFVDPYSSYTVAGTSALCGTEWDVANTANDLTLGDDGIYSITFVGVAAGDHKFKVAADHSWDNAWPAQDYAFNLTEACDVTIKFNPKTQKVEVLADKLGESVTPPAGDGLYTVAGQSALCGSDWSTTDTYNDMILNAETGLYEKTFTGIPAGTYECKVVVNHSWDVSYGGSSGEFGNYGFTIDEELNVTITFDPVSCVVSHYTSASTGAGDRPQPEKPEIDYEDTITLYLSNTANWENPMVYYWTQGSADQNAAWPGQPMEWDSDKLLYYVVVPTYYVNIIFNDGNGVQTADLVIPGDGGIFDNVSNEWGHISNFTPPKAPENTTEDVTVYVKDGMGWGEMYIYFWDINGIEAAVWPGVAMELDENGYYTYTIPAGYSNVIFNNGGSWEDGSLQQTADLNIPKDGKVYYNNSANGDDGWNAGASQGGNQGEGEQGGNQGGDNNVEQPKGEMTLLQKLAKALLMFLRQMEEFFKNLFPAPKQ
jgi:hypothetical protein